MTEYEKNLILVTLQNGIGLTLACEVTMLNIKYVSNYIKQNQDYHSSCLNAIKSAATTNIMFLDKLKREKKYREWQNQQDKTKTFIVELTLWECYCRKEDITQEKVLKAAYMYKTIEECATAIGMTKNELKDYIISNENLSLYFSQSNTFQI